MSSALAEPSAAGITSTNPAPGEEPSYSTSVDAATYIVDVLTAIGVEYVFGVPGGAIEPLMNALAISERAGGPKAVIARHETGAAFMAEGYARQTGKLGVCCATSGPGATNLITGVACASESNIPMLVITGQPAIGLFGKRALQESSCTGVDVLGMFKHCTNFNSLISHPDQVQGKVTAAVMRALQTPHGPSHLSIPVDILRTPIEPDINPETFAKLTKPHYFFDPQSVSQLHCELVSSKKSVFVIGRGCEGAVLSIVEIASRLGAPFVVTPDAKGLINTQHPLYKGVIGFAGHESATDVFSDDVDTVILAGSSVSEWTSAAWNSVMLSSRLIHVDSTPDNLLHSAMARKHVLGNLQDIFNNLAVEIAKDYPSVQQFPVHCAERLAIEQDHTVDSGGVIKPQHLMTQLSAYMPAGTRFIADAGNSTAWAIHYLEEPGVTSLPDSLPSPLPQKNWLHVLMDFAPMGWAIGTAVGLSRGDNEGAVVCLTGDGSYLMNGQEITTAAQEGLPVIFVILNDSALGMVKHGQRLAGAQQTGFELPQINYALMAHSMGIDAHVITSADDFDRLDFDAMAKAHGPTLLDVRIDGEEVPPMKMRLKILNQD